LDEKFQAMINHAQCFEAIHGPERFVRMRKHLGWYCSGFPHAAAMRAQLVRTQSTADVVNLIDQYQARALDNRNLGIPATIAAS
jgi:tRNA-dihydrouridine synthase